MFSGVLYYIVNFEIIALDKLLLLFSSGICYYTAALPCKRVVNKRYAPVTFVRLLKDYYECLACIKSKQTRMIKKLKISMVSRD